MITFVLFLSIYNHLYFYFILTMLLINKLYVFNKNQESKNLQFC
jgi:hypothetical protein